MNRESIERSDMSFKGKVVFVAGGTSGINLGIAEGFARAGARVAVLSRRQEKVDAAVAGLEQLGAEALGFAADVREYEAIETALAATAQQWGPIDVLISGAAGNFLAPAAKLSANAFKSVVDIDLLGTFNVLRAAYDHLRKPGASVINITAPQAWQPMPYQVHACAAKAGVDQVTRTTAMEWGPAGIRVNGIAPGPIADTEGMRRLAPTEAIAQAVMRSVPLGRMGRVDDIARAALWLSSEDADYVSGVILPVDGGWSLGGASGMTAGLA
jgi:NAD(P)-dependent dehydrogenase (short-subunit alcohol dehydrogenase family)